MSGGRLRRLLHGVEDAVLEGSVFLAYGKPGFRRRSKRWDPADTAVDMAGRVCVVSGANAGIGLATCTALAGRGATVVMACRNLERGAAARDALLAAQPDASLVLEQVDVSAVGEVLAFAGRLRERFESLDVLVNNAGVLLPERRESADGIELTFATNVLGGWLLTRELVPLLQAAPQGRVIHVTSGGMYTQRFDLDDPFWQRRPWDGVRAYAQTKRAQVILSELWAERLEPSRVTSNTMHPGWAATPGVARSLPRFDRWMKRLLRDSAEGADTIVWLAVSPTVAEASGQLYFDRSARRTHVRPGTRMSPADRAALWTLCEQLTTDVA